MAKYLDSNLLGTTLSRIALGVSLQLTNAFLALLVVVRGLGQNLPIWQICAYMSAFYLLYSVTCLVLVYPGGRLINRYGARMGFILWSGGRAVSSILLTAYILGGPGWIIVPFAVTFAVSIIFSLLTQAYHVSRVIGQGNHGRKLSRAEAVVQLATGLVPLAGGLLVTALGQLWLGAIATAAALIGIAPAWRSDRLAGGHKPVPAVTWSQRAPWPDLAACLAWSFQTGVGFWAWAIYVAVVVHNFAAAGVVATFSLIPAVMATLLANRMIDTRQHGARKLLLVIVAFCSSIHLIRAVAVGWLDYALSLVVASMILVAASIVYSASNGLLQVSWQANYYPHARLGGINYVVSMETASCVAHILLWSGLTALAYLNKSPKVMFATAFSVAAVLVWCCLLIRRYPSVTRPPEATPETKAQPAP